MPTVMTFECDVCHARDSGQGGHIPMGWARLNCTIIETSMETREIGGVEQTFPKYTEDMTRKLYCHECKKEPIAKTLLVMRNLM